MKKKNASQTFQCVSPTNYTVSRNLAQKGIKRKNWSLLLHLYVQYTQYSTNTTGRKIYESQML